MRLLPVCHPAYYTSHTLMTKKGRQMLSIEHEHKLCGKKTAHRCQVNNKKMMRIVRGGGRKDAALPTGSRPFISLFLCHGFHGFPWNEFESMDLNEIQPHTHAHILFGDWMLCSLRLPFKSNTHFCRSPLRRGLKIGRLLRRITQANIRTESKSDDEITSLCFHFFFEIPPSHQWCTSLFTTTTLLSLAEPRSNPS